jgi:hypothetical protein
MKYLMATESTEEHEKINALHGGTHSAVGALLKREGFVPGLNRA